jgi:hypothetical protein
LAFGGGEQLERTNDARTLKIIPGVFPGLFAPKPAFLQLFVRFSCCVVSHETSQNVFICGAFDGRSAEI